MDGVVQKTARADRESGCSLGLLSFNRTAASGLHQHHGVATNFVLSGSLSDYQDDYPIGSVITNLAGTTHDEISWNGCMLVSRTEGPIVYLLKAELADANHSGGQDLFRNPAPDRPPSLDRPLRSASAATRPRRSATTSNIASRNCQWRMCSAPTRLLSRAAL
jgi:hypothetical protein